MHRPHNITVVTLQTASLPGPAQLVLRVIVRLQSFTLPFRMPAFRHLELWRGFSLRVPSRLHPLHFPPFVPYTRKCWNWVSGVLECCYVPCGSIGALSYLHILLSPGYLFGCLKNFNYLQNFMLHCLLRISAIYGLGSQDNQCKRLTTHTKRSNAGLSWTHPPHGPSQPKPLYSEWTLFDCKSYTGWVEVSRWDQTTHDVLY